MTEVNNDALLLNTLRLLFVEDDPDATRELAHYLKKRVSSLAVAANGREALELCASNTFDVILTDLRMPEMDGLTFIRHLRASNTQTPVVIMSAFSDSETILQAVDLGIVKYCVKPVNIAELTAALAKVASERLADAGVPVLPDSRLLDRQQRLEIEKKISELRELYPEMAEEELQRRAELLTARPDAAPATIGPGVAGQRIDLSDQLSQQGYFAGGTISATPTTFERESLQSLKAIERNTRNGSTATWGT